MAGITPRDRRSILYGLAPDAICYKRGHGVPEKHAEDRCKTMWMMKPRYRDPGRRIHNQGFEDEGLRSCHEPRQLADVTAVISVAMCSHRIPVFIELLHIGFDNDIKNHICQNARSDPHARRIRDHYLTIPTSTPELPISNHDIKPTTC